MPFWKWSKTADLNSTADPTINWAEGQAPSTINDSSRAVMARLAEWRDDLGNAGVTGGSATAYTLTTNQGLSSPPATPALIAFIAHATSGFNPTLSTDSGTPYPIWNTNGAAAAPGTIKLGVLYTASFVGSGWLIHNASNNFSVPVGALMDFTGTNLPAGGNFIFPYGQAISRASYSEYYSIVGTTYGGGDGSTTFNVPNLKGRMTAALDSLGDGVPAGVLNTIGGGVTMGAAGGNQYYTVGQNNLPNYNLTGGTGAAIVSGTTATESVGHFHTGSGTTTGQSQNHSHAYSATLNAGPTGLGSGPFSAGGDGQTAAANQDHTHSYSFSTATQSTLHTHTFSASGSVTSVGINSGGGGVALNPLPPIMLVTKILRII